MRILVLVVVLLSLLMLSCSPSDAGEALVKESTLDTALTGEVVSDAFERYCETDASCGPSQRCVENNCVASAD